MHLLKTVWEPLFLSMLGLAGVSSLLAMASPRAFAVVASYGSLLVGSTKTQTRLDKWIDIDRLVMRHVRFFGFLVCASVVYLWLLSAYGPEACSRPFLVLIVGVSLATSILALVEIKKQKRQIQTHLSEARTDTLTGLANRRSFDIELDRRIAQRQRQGTPLCLMVVDVDHFKTFNDTYGHHVGDAILKKVAGALAKNVRQMEVIARMGGDEFAVSLAGSDLSEASLAAERLRKAVCSQPFFFEGSEHQITVSIGLAEAFTDDDATSLMKRSDSALYAAKENGRNRSYRQGSPEPAVPAPCT